MANLWDVTDRDIDRFAAALLGEWLVGGEEGGGGGGGGRGNGETTTMTNGNNPNPNPNKPTLRCVAASVARARRACRLPSLIGAAPVVYGVPTAVKVSRNGSGGSGGEVQAP